MLMFDCVFEIDAWSRFWKWNLIKICVRTCDLNSTLGSAVPLAMFWFPCLHMLPNCPTIIMNSILLSTVQCKHSLFGRNLIFQFWIKHSRSNFDPPFNLDLCARKSGKGRSVDISQLLIVDCWSARALLQMRRLRPLSACFPFHKQFSNNMFGIILKGQIYNF